MKIIKRKCKIALIDDNFVRIDQMKALIREYEKFHNMEISISEYEDFDFILKSKTLIKANIDLIIVKIENTINGMGVVDEIRLSQCIDVPMIFVSNEPGINIICYSEKTREHKILSYEQNKNYDLEEALNLYFKNHNRYTIEVCYKRKKIEINADNILYIEASNKQSIIYLTMDDAPLKVNRLLKNFEDMLPEDMFIRAHKGFIVNKKYIVDTTHKYYILVNGLQIPIGRSRKESVLA